MSKREYEKILKLLKLDIDFFQTPHMIVDISTYGDLSRDVKEILYRPTKVQELREKYWHLTRNQIPDEDVPDKVVVEFHHRHKYPQKDPNDYIWVDKIVAKIDELIETDD